MSQTATVLVEDVTEKKGTNRNGKPFTRWALKDGNGDWYSTFQEGVVVAAMKGQKYDIEWEQDGDFKNLLRASPVDDSPITARTQSGEADWDLIGLRKTRCALWAAYLPGALEAGWTEWRAAQSTEPGTADIQHFLIRFGRQLVLAAELDIFTRETPQEGDDVPF